MLLARPSPQRFRGVLVRSILIPLLLMLLLAGIFVWQIGRLIANTRFVEAIDQAIAEYNRLEKLHIDLETGLRGFLLTGDDAFLSPFTMARQALAEAAPTSWQDALGPNDQIKHLDLSKQRERWLDYADAQIGRRRVGDATWQTALANRDGKRIMDEIRRQFDELIVGLERTRKSENERVQQSAQMVVFTSVGAALAVGLLLALASRGQLTWLSRSYDAALGQANDLSVSLERRVEERTTEVVRTNHQLAEANRELEAFAYSVSHDLRAPMRHITGFSKLVLNGARDRLTADDIENLDTIHGTAVLAGRMVDDLLAFSRVGRTAMRQDIVDMNGLVQRVLAEQTADVAGRGIKFDVAELPPTVGDSALLKLVWQNLIANAIKYTANAATPEIEIGVDFEATAPDAEGNLKLSELGPAYFIRDNGVGFDMAYAHKLFGVFQRLHRAEEFEGTGIGLANVRRIIVRHHGQVWADGRVNEGATFWFRLPERPATIESA